MKFKNIFLILIIFLSVGVSCKREKTDGTVPVIMEEKKVPEAAVEAKDPPVSEELLVTSLFLSGRLQTADKSLPIGSYLKNDSYGVYKKKIHDHWTQYKKLIYDPLVEWRKKNIPKVDNKLVFYPFSGPDFPNANALYPDAQEYIMIGLEPGGFEPNIDSMNKDRVMKGLFEIVASQDSISRLNFYMTNKMKQNISASVFKGTAPVILTYFGLLGFKPLSLRSIAVNDEGNIEYLTQKEIDEKYKSGNVSVEFIFLDAEGRKKKLIYFSANVANEGIAAKPNVMKFLEKKESFVSTFKAASYLVHYANFSKIKDYVISKAEMIVMDDTGPRISDLKKDFDITVYGKYTRPIALWPGMYQSALMDLHTKQKPAPINFRFGYGTLHGTHHLMLAKRKEKTGTPSEPPKDAPAKGKSAPPVPETPAKGK